MASRVQVSELLVAGQRVTGRVRYDRDMIDVTPAAEPDPHWVRVDEQGHQHRWMAGPDPLVPLVSPARQQAVLPTLRRVPDPPFWCEGCRDVHEFAHYECSVCGEPVEPAMRPTLKRRYINGPLNVTIEVDEPLPRGTVTVTVLGDPPQIATGEVVTSVAGRGFDGQRIGWAQIVLTSPLGLVEV